MPSVKNKPKKKVHSKGKGIRGELEFVHLLKDYGYFAERSQQYSGLAGRDSADVICKDLSFLHFEVKRVECLNLTVAYAQACKDKNDNQAAIVAHKRNHGEWMITLSAINFLKIVRPFKDRRNTGK